MYAGGGGAHGSQKRASGTEDTGGCDQPNMAAIPNGVLWKSSLNY